MINQDLFVSHSGADKERYIYPLAESLRRQSIAIWLDEIEVGWGDSIALKINDGLRASRFVLVCLSKNYCCRPWPEQELGSALAMQNSDGKKRVLPLILNSRDEVLEKYPLLAGFVHKEYRNDPDEIASDVVALLNIENLEARNLPIIAESAHTGKRFELVVPPRASNYWVTSQIQAQFGLRREVDTGGSVPMEIRWILVDSRVKADFRNLSRDLKAQLYVMALTDEGVKASTSAKDRFDELGTLPGTIFHLFPVQVIEEEEEE